MKTYFLHEPSKTRRIHWYNNYTVISEYGGSFTYDYTLPQAIFMAYELMAGLYLFPDDTPEPILSLEDIKSLWKQTSTHFPLYHVMDIDVDIYAWGWVRKGDLPPATSQHFRAKQYRKAFAMSYKDIPLNILKAPTASPQ